MTSIFKKKLTCKKRVCACQTRHACKQKEKGKGKNRKGKKLISEYFELNGQLPYVICKN